ncbi:MAG: hypothetical protein D6782_12150, partial [Alphaproteobacteria bacterium]
MVGQTGDHSASTASVLEGAVMTSSAILALLLLLSAVGFLVARRKALQAASGNGRALHSKPVYHGWYTALAAFVPGALILAAWLTMGDWLVDGMVLGALPDDARPASTLEERVLLNAIHSAARGEMALGKDAVVAAAAERYSRLRELGSLGVLALASLFATIGILRGTRAARPQFRARNAVERFLALLL